MAEEKFILLYDGKCPICRRTVQWLRRLDRERGRLDFRDVTACAFDPDEYGVSMDAVMREIHGIRSDGEIIKAADVVRESFRQVGMGWLAAILSWPLVRPMSDRLYHFVSRHRPRHGGEGCSACAGRGECS